MKLTQILLDANHKDVLNLRTSDGFLTIVSNSKGHEVYQPNGKCTIAKNDKELSTIILSYNQI